MLYEKFGEMDSAGEINTLAENLFNEGDIKALKEMAKENGIDPEMTEMYISGQIPALTDVTMAAAGKIDVEEAELQPKTIMIDWIEYIRELIMGSEIMAHKVRKKGKSLKGCISHILKWSFKNMVPVDKEILKAAGVTQTVKLGIPSMADAKKLIREYYMEG